MNQSLAARLEALIKELRSLVKEYDLLTPDKQREVRHELYKLTDRFGKLFMPVFDDIAEAEKMLSQIKKEQVI